MSNKNLSIVADEDLKTLLQNLQLLEKIENKQIKCKFCKKVITIANIYSIFPESGDIKIVCDEPACIKQMSLYFMSTKIWKK